MRLRQGEMPEKSPDFGNFVELAENAVFREPYSMEWIKSREPLQD